MRVEVIVVAGIAATLAAAGAGSCIAYLRRHYLAVQVRGTSMEPTLADHCTVIARRLRSRRVSTGDLVLFHPPDLDPRLLVDEGLPKTLTPTVEFEIVTAPRQAELSIKRVVAVAGGAPPPAYRSGSRAPVPAGCVLVLGDNADSSIDSRHFGPVPVSTIRGVVVRPRAGRRPDRRPGRRR